MMAIRKKVSLPHSSLSRVAPRLWPRTLLNYEEYKVIERRSDQPTNAYPRDIPSLVEGKNGFTKQDGGVGQDRQILPQTPLMDGATDEIRRKKVIEGKIQEHQE